VSLKPHTTPADDIFLCSSSTPPGGGVHGMCGFWAAEAALKRWESSCELPLAGKERSNARDAHSYLKTAEPVKVPNCREIGRPTPVR